jgi:citrate lyase subunit beta / citryl-CoA lyase
MTAAPTAVPRSCSYLYVPGDQPQKLSRSLDRGADAVIVDLEDAVAPAAKASARAAVAEWLRSRAPRENVEVWVRINPGAAGHEDAAALVGPGLAGVVAAKTQSAADLVALDAALRGAEAGAGLPVGQVAVVPLLESAAAVLDASGVARGPRVRQLQIGEADLRADIGLPPGDGETELLHVRSHVVLVSAACGLAPPVGPVSTDFRDLTSFRMSTRALARLGFVSRACIHPAQVAVVNDVFTPTPEEIGRARALVARFEQAVAAGGGVLLDDAGRMVDEAVVRQARRLLGRAR